jgi:uncharacterized protein YdeI (YjbR/CyaY-like superfamily)
MKEINTNNQVDKYLIDGCMRCKYGGTPQCKVVNWVVELELLKQIVLESGLIEELKWGVPVYTLKGKNVVTMMHLKNLQTLDSLKVFYSTIRIKYSSSKEKSNLVESLNLAM